MEKIDTSPNTNQDISDNTYLTERTRAENMQALGSDSGHTFQNSHTPYCNTGYEHPLTRQTPQKPSPLLSFRFDWYAATLDKEVEPLEVLRWAQFFGESAPGKQIHGYDTCHDFGVFKVLYGGHSGQFGPHVIIHGGDRCPDIVQSFRTYFPEHRPSRIDVCLDFKGSDAWDDLYQLVTLTSGRFGVKSRLYGDFINAETGRTIYLGTGNSTHKCRLYEKGHEMRSKGVQADAPLDWVRLELQVAPTAISRASAAIMTPDQVARSTKWTKYLCDTLRTVSAPSVNLSTRKKKPDVIDSFEHFCGQYCSTIFQVQKQNLIPRKDFIRIVLDMYDKGEFKGLPETCYRNWYF